MEELQSLVQIMELYGRGLDMIGRFIKWSGKGAEKGVDLIKLKEMQHKLKLHYASTGKHDTLPLKDLEKLTGGKYNILNIPLEDEGSLVEFYDRLKKTQCSFSELPDLNLGDGFTQIAYNPQDADKIKLVIDYYVNQKKFTAEDAPKDITTDEYVKTGGQEGEKKLTDLAKKIYLSDAHKEQLEDMQKKISDPTIKEVPITVDKDSLVLKETDKSYFVKIPVKKTGGKDSEFWNNGHRLAIEIPKSDALLINNGKTILTFLKRQNMYMCPWGDEDDFLNPDLKHVAYGNGDQISSAFDGLSKEDMEKFLKLTSDTASEDMFPNFNVGQEETPVLRSDTKTEGSEKSLGAKEKIKKMLSDEQIKIRSASKDFIPFNFSLKDSVVAETKGAYLVYAPDKNEEKNGIVQLIKIPKGDAALDSTQKRLTAYLRRNDLTDVLSYNNDGKLIDKKSLFNKELGSIFNVSQSEVISDLTEKVVKKI